MTRYERLKTALVESQSWYTHKQLCETLGVASSDCSVILKQLEQEGAAQRVKPPKDFARGAQWIFAAAGVEPPDGAGLPPKMKGFKAEARAAKSDGKRAKKKQPSAKQRADDMQIGGDHYKGVAVQPWTAMAAWMPGEQFAGFLRGNAIKYLARCDAKGGIEDLKKARHYLDKLIEVTEGTL